MPCAAADRTVRGRLVRQRRGFDVSAGSLGLIFIMRTRLQEVEIGWRDAKKVSRPSSLRICSSCVIGRPTRLLSRVAQHASCFSGLWGGVPIPAEALRRRS